MPRAKKRAFDVQHKSLRSLEKVPLGSPAIVAEATRLLRRLTFMSLPLLPSAVSPRLVDEASHHLALKRLVDLDDGSDRTQWLPVAERLFG